MPHAVVSPDTVVMPTYLVDSQGRRLDYLRLAVTDRCNLRCRYCMPGDGVELVGHREILTHEENLRLARLFCGLGVRKIRVTGGEPLRAAGRRAVHGRPGRPAVADPRYC